MTNIQVWILINVAFSFGLSIVYFHLYKQYQEKYMGVWSLGWFFFSTRISLDLLRFIGYSNIVLLFLNQLVTISSAGLLLMGMYIFCGESFPKKWYYFGALATIATDIGIIVGLPIVISATPTAFYFGLVNIKTGIMFLRFWRIRGFGKKVTGFTLILVGLLNLTYPLIVSGLNAYTATRFFAMGSVLWIIILMGTLLVYFDKVRNELHENEERFRLLVENARDIIYRFNLTPTRHFAYISPSIELTGYKAEEFYKSSESILELIDKHYQSEVKKSLVDPLKPCEFLIHTKSGQEVWVEQHSVPIYDDSDCLIAVEGIVRDISQRKKVSAEMARLGQLRIIGQTAAGIAHEIRNPMTTVRGFLQLLMMKPDLKPYDELMNLSIGELDRANTIITEFLSLSKEKKSLFKRQSLNTIISTLIPLLQSNALETSKNIKVELDEIPDLLLDEREIRQVILNLVQNGLEAMDVEGTLVIRTFQKDEEVVLAIQDQGKGIEPELLEKLGEPFLTTKDKGTGLGLAVSYSIAHRHKAKVEVESTKHGTTFYIKFQMDSELLAIAN